MRVLVGVLVITLLVAGGVFAYIKLFGGAKASYKDKRYGFEISDQSGWYLIPQKKDVYYSLGTSDSSRKTVISYFGVSPVKSAGVSTQSIGDMVSQSCISLANERKQNQTGFDEVTLNGKSGFECVSEGKPDNVDKVYTFRLYTLLGGSGAQYDYVLSASFPKGDAIEEGKVNRIVNSFRFN